MKRNSKKNKKIRSLILVCTLTAILLTVSTYAWFIGMKTVKVNSFEVKIATTEGLFLSMDGENWFYNLDAKNAAAYTGNANQWLTGKDDGLIPVSTIGDMDKTSSRLKLYEKGSFTATKGGYRLLASRVINNNAENVTAAGEFIEGDGYVAFDLFIKNLSGDEYYVANDRNNEEAIYLTYDSAVTVGEGGAVTSGIQNSVRVAFAQIGRVIATTTNVGTITGINCKGTDNPTQKTDVTGICREATIWEPNDTAHVDNAINWYNTSCKKRTAGATTFTYAESDNACTAVVNGEASPTYAIANPLLEGSYVDIYDGSKFNGFGDTVQTYANYAAADQDGKAAAKLVDYDYFTDTEKMDKGNQRKTFMTLAPNSITKVRVYIYLEGQDIDNYDFAQLGKSIKVNFGFTKERFTGDSDDGFNYDGPELVTGDDNA